MIFQSGLDGTVYKQTLYFDDPDLGKYDLLSNEATETVEIGTGELDLSTGDKSLVAACQGSNGDFYLMFF